MKKALWLDALNITENQLDGWIIEKPQDISTSYWCLKKNYINATEYITWAKNHYQIPAMDHNYKNFNIDPDFWLQIKSVSNWSDKLVPLYFYENTIFVLSTEPLEMNWSFPVQYVLGTPEQLSYFWNKLNSQQVATTPNPVMAESVSAKPNHLPPDMPSTDVRKPLSEMTESVKEQSSSKMNPPNDDLLNLNFTSSSDKPQSGFDALATQFNISTSDGNSDQESPADILEGFDAIKTTSTPMSLEGLDGLEGLDLKPESVTSDFEGLNLKSDSTTPSALEGLNLNPEKTEEPEAIINLSSDAPSDMPPLSTTTQSLRLNNVAEAKPTAVKTETPAPAVAINLSPAPQQLKAETPVTATSEAQGPIGQLNVLNKVNQYFKKSLVFKLSNNYVSVSHQDGSWDLSELKNIELTKTPSLFNFCLISKLPFHGPVSEKDSLKAELFQSLKISNTSEHITLMPLVNNNSIDHFVLAVGDSQNLKNLSELEKAVPELLSEIG